MVITDPVPSYRLVIIRDHDPLDWRSEGEPISRFATWKPRHQIGDEQPKCDPEEWLESLLSDDAKEAMEAFRDEYPMLVNAPYNSQKYRDYHRSRNEATRTKLMELVEREYAVRPVFCYHHSGLSIRTRPFSCPWDSGQIGWIVLSDAAAKEHGITEPEAFLEAEIEEYNWYLTGEVWGFEVLKCLTCNLGHSHEDVVDSCWGFSGDTLEVVKSGMSDHVSSAYGFTDHDWEVAWGARLG